MEETLKCRQNGSGDGRSRGKRASCRRLGLWMVVCRGQCYDSARGLWMVVFYFNKCLPSSHTPKTAILTASSFSFWCSFPPHRPPPPLIQAGSELRHRGRGLRDRYPMCSSSPMLLSSPKCCIAEGVLAFPKYWPLARRGSYFCDPFWAISNCPWSLLQFGDG